MSETGSESEPRGRFRFTLFLALGIAVAVIVFSAFIDSERQAPLYVDAAMAWLAGWIGLLFVLLAPIVGIWMLRTQDLTYIVLLPIAFFLGGAALLGLGAWGPFVGLAAVVLAAAGIAIWRPADDEAP